MRIFLIGFMGSGKSFWASRWAASMGMEWVDLDREIEKAEQMPVAEIFEQKGQDYFRRAEGEQLRMLETRDNILVSCGGGTPCYESNMDWMNSHGKTVYLSASPQLLFERLAVEIENRPLLKNINEAEILFFIESTLRERLPFYEKASQTLMVPALNDLSWKSLI